MRPPRFAAVAVLLPLLAGCAGVPKAAGPAAPGAAAASLPAAEPAAAAPAAGVGVAPAAGAEVEAGEVLSPTPEPAPPPAASLPTVPPPPAPPPARARPAAPGVEEEGAAERYVSLNFDNADLSVVVQTVAELLKLNYIVAPNVRGRVTIQTTQKLPVSALFPVLEQILEVNNLTAVRSGDFWKILPAGQAKQEALETVAPEVAVGDSGVVTKIVRLSYISPAEVIKILTPFKTQAGVYQGHEAGRLLFLTESAAKIPDLLRIVELLDVDTFAAIQVELVPVRYAAVDELAKEITQMVTMVYAAAGRSRTLFRLMPVPQVGALMVFTGEPGLAANVRDWVARLDQPATETNERIFVYPLSHATAETLAGVLERVFKRDERSGSSGQSGQRAAVEPEAPAPVRTPARNAGARAQAQAQARAAVPRATAAATAAESGAGEGIATGSGANVTIVADKDTNSLIIQTSPWYYPVVEATIRKLDRMPRQVLIEVLIAEISLDDDNQFGLQWALRGQGSLAGSPVRSFTQNAYSTGGVPGGPLTPGFSVFVAEANRLTGVINAYAKDSKLNVLSAPHIFATDNKEAKIDVGQEVPILKTKTTATAGSTTVDNNTVTNDIEYRSTGIILTVTPHINEGGFVTLEVQQEVSEAQTNTLGGTDSPIIRKRTAKTTMVVKDDQTLVIGGLIEQKQDHSREGIPFLSRIPILGYLFGTTTAKVHKTELVLLITPRVVETPEEGTLMTEQFQGRVLTLKKGIADFRKEKP